MSPTFRDGQLVLVSKSDTDFETDDVIVFTSGGNGYMIKRIVAVAGDTVLLGNGSVWRNGVRFSGYTYDASGRVEYLLSDDTYFVIGDNFNASVDSRNYGPVSKEDILGKVILY